jgi:hypothetical protein
VEDSTGGAVTSNSTILSLGNVAVGGTPGTAAISIRNTGPGYLRNLALSRDGTHSSEFTTGPLVYSTLAPGSNATVTVSFSPASGGNRTARLLIASNDPAKNPFTVLLGGFGIGTNLDTDGDGLNDAAEFGMSGLGFDWRTSQPNLVGSLAQNADKAGYFDEQSVRDMNVGMPLISKNATTGKFKLTIELEKSTNLGQGFQPMPFEETGTYLTQDGKLQFEFNSPDNAGFFRLKAK